MQKIACNPVFLLGVLRVCLPCIIGLCIINLFPKTVMAQEYNSKDCPLNFEYIDFGTWTEDGEFTFSGRALPLGRFSKSGNELDLVRYGCGKVQKEKQFIGDSQVALVKAVELFLPFSEIREPAHVGAKIRIYRLHLSAAMSKNDPGYPQVFDSWMQSARETGRRAIAEGAGYSCTFEHDNPRLRNYGNYTCLIDISGMDKPKTFISCKQYGGCELYFRDNQGMVFDFEITNLRWNTRFSHARSIPEAVKLWSEFALNFYKNFSANTTVYAELENGDKR